MAARERVNVRLGRTPTDADLAGELGLEVDDVVRARADIARAGVESLNVAASAGPAGDGGDLDVDRIDTIASPDGDVADPAEQVARRDLHRRFSSAMRSLSETDRELVRLLYLEDRTQREAATFLGVTESRVSQMHSKLRSRLKLALSEHRESFRAIA
jgi:RNA polymerase sigma factor for flagellar operon FliA